ncbi:MAG: hypothetical protein ABIY55_08090 [Kofleriaceae bacterium]
MKLRIMSVACVLAFSVACMTDADAPGPSMAMRDLGVSRFDFVEADTRLVIVARDQSGTILASLELTTGRFYMKDDNRGDVDGRQLTVNAFGKNITHESAGYNPLNLPFPHEPLVGAFLTEPVVAAKLSHWGIRIDPNSVPASEQLAPEEKASYIAGSDCASYGAFSTDSSSAYGASCRFSSYGGCATHGFQVMFPKSAGEWGEYRCCLDLEVFAERVCTTPFGPTSCGGAGPNGCAVCWFTPIETPPGWENPACQAEIAWPGYCLASFCTQ